MSESSFNKLVHILWPQVSMDELQLYCNTGGNNRINSEMFFGAGLWSLGGQHMKSIVDIFGMSDLSDVRIVNNFLAAVDSKLEKTILPSTSELS